MRVAVIGAGAAGLPAAYDLLKAGHEAVVYERAPFIGGHASTFDVGGSDWNGATITGSRPTRTS